MTQRNEYQKGASLIIALIFLLILSLIGVSSMQGTTMQEKMSGNLRDKYTSFNSAEAALLEGEEQASKDYKNDSLDIDDVASGSYASTFALPNPPTWTAELLTTEKAGIKDGAKDLAGVLKVQAQSSGMSGKSDVVLESIYVVK